MYAIVHNEEIIAIHDDINVVIEYKEQNNYSDMVIIKIKNKSISKIYNLDDVYLMKYKGKYIQSKLYDVLTNTVNESLYELEFSKNTLSKLLEDKDIGKKDSSAIRRVLKLIDKEIHNVKKEEIPTSVLRDICELNKNYNDKF